MPIELTNRVFTTVSSHPYEVVKWEKTPVKITDESGNIIYELNEAEFPTTWSKTARKITANKYFRESRDSKEKETSLKETITRIVTFIRRRGEEHGYFEIGSESPQIFEDELTHILLNQIAAFNSPVWFNTGVPGVDKPLMSACFINQVDDNMESILDLAKTEGLIFKEGAGSGVNFSRLRASTERIRGGGTASGPVSFMQGYDSFANIIMSGGRTRRSARMCILNADHPDIEKFISCKNEQEAIVERLIKSGMSAKFNDLEGAYSWAKHQTGNNSVRVTNEFMERVRQHMYYGKEEKWNLINRADGSIARTVDIGELFTKIAKCAHGCGDPALQFHDSINEMNPCIHDFTIEASNPCFGAEMRLTTPNGFITFKEAAKQGTLPLINAQKKIVLGKVWTTGKKETVKITFMPTSKKPPIVCTPNHKFKLNDGTSCEAQDLKGKKLMVPYKLKTTFKREAFLAGFLQGDGSTYELRPELLNRNRKLRVHFGKNDEDIARMFGQNIGTWHSREARIIAEKWGFSCENLPKRELPKNLPKEAVCDFLAGLFSANGGVIKNTRITLNTTCKRLAEQVTNLLNDLEIKSYITTGKEIECAIPTKNKKYISKERYIINILRYESLIAFAEQISFKHKYKQDALKQLLFLRSPKVINVKPNGVQTVYDFSIPKPHWGIVEKCAVHNCGEYLFTNNSACNLASINLVKFMRNDNIFDTKTFKHVVRTMIIAQDIIVESASYPTKDIELNSLKYRPLGLGYANLGSLLMRWGIPYDSDKGREIAASITSLMTAQAYTTSAELATVKGPFSAYEYNKVSMEEVLAKHRAFTKKIPESNLQLVAYKAWGEALAAGFGRKKEEGSGYRNAQVTVLAPTGSISFAMDCDTTGIEPAMGLIAYKDMVGGGTLKIAVDAIPEALSSLGYSTLIIPKILQYISDNGYVEGCPDIKEEHLPVFDCAFVAKTRTISVEGHINMVAAVQPFLSGGVSKTFNMPKSATVDEVKRAYMMAWERGLKGVAIYRQGSKFSEPMRAREVLEAVEEKKSIVPTRRELPTTVVGIRHAFTVGAHKIYLHCDLDPETGNVAEIFIRAGGFGSTVGGLLDTYATLFSKALQYGIPLEICLKHMEGSNFPPAGITSNQNIPMVKSIMDYIARWMKQEMIDKKIAPSTLAHPDTENGVTYAPVADDSQQNLSEDTCPRCGHIMVRTGSCTMCKNCSHNTGVCG
jgi:ribonucleoside-diphosphate reductase alpha chain